jgi:transcription initiation factor TFIID subunit 1
MYENSVTFNGPNHIVTACAQQVYELGEKKMKENEAKLFRLEKLINPLLDENYKRRLIYILNQVMDKLKILPEASPFLKPVNKKTVKNYYDVIENPMDLETIEIKIREGEYQSRYDFMAHMDLIHLNAIQFNGAQHQITEKARSVVEFARAILQEFDEHLTLLEIKIQKMAQGKSSPSQDNEDSLGGGFDDLSMTGMEAEGDADAEGEGDVESDDFEEVEIDSNAELPEDAEDLNPLIRDEQDQGQEQDEEEEGEYITDDEEEERGSSSKRSASDHGRSESEPEPKRPKFD